MKWDVYFPKRLQDALVGSGITLLSLPTRLIQQLGLTPLYSKRVTN